MTARRNFGLYVHWPFCQAKCPYCDFNSHVVSRVDQADWQSAFLAEIARVSDAFPDRVLDTIYFGGGTPSLMLPATVDAIISAARQAWPLANDAEITLEANPSSVEAGRFRGYAAAGVNRVSIGVQALNDADLKRLGRLHDGDEARAAVALAQEVFPRVSFDLIYARQEQTLEDWERELSEALAMGTDHLSLYQLTIEQGTAFGDRFARGRLRGLPDEDLSADLYELTQTLTESAGLPAYEVSNHARPGSESRHNLIYWRNHDWAGIGPGAHGRFTSAVGRVATEAHPAPAAWLNAVANGSGDSLTQTLPEGEITEEAVMMGLRLREGVPQSLLSNKLSEINILCELGLICQQEDRITVTPQGRPLLNAILRQLLT